MLSLHIIHESLNHIILTESTYDHGYCGQRMSDGGPFNRYAGKTSYQICIKFIDKFNQFKNLIILGTTTSGTTTRELDIRVNII